MKRLFAGAVALALLLSLFGCSAKKPKKPEATPAVRPVSVLNATVADISDNLLLLAGTDEGAGTGDLYTAAADAEIIGLDGKAAQAQALKAGMSVAVEYDGDISGNTEARKIPAKKITVLNEGNDLIGFYFGVLKETLEADDALNADIETIAFDFSELGNLRESEKTALMYLLSKDAGLPYISGTYEQLGEQGLIDTKNLCFPTGVLLKISTREETADSFSFDISKWRGGLGAIGTNDCKATLETGAWSYEPGGSWIS